MLSAPRRLLAAFLLLLLLPAAALVWLGTRLLDQDRAIQTQQSEERRASAADRVVAALEQSVSASERRYSPSNPPGDDAVLVQQNGSHIEVYPPERLLYFPEEPSPDIVATFAAAEALEYRNHDYSAAAIAFRELAESPKEEVRAGALMRLARNLRRLGHTQEALNAYQELMRLKNVPVDGVPAGLAARRARATLAGSPDRDLEADLLTGRWRLDRGTFFAYIGDQPLPPARQALSDAVVWFQQSGMAGRQAMQFEGVEIAVLRQDSTALVAGPEFQKHEWFTMLAAAAAGFDVTLTARDGRAVLGSLPAAVFTTRHASDTVLPWNVLVSGTNTPSSTIENRRRILLGGLALLVVLVLSGGYFTLRGVLRELAAARLQTDFVSSVSHEFRSPLTSLRQFTDLLQEDDNLPAEKRHRFYQAQARATDRLQRLVESLLDFGRMEAGAHPYRLQRLDARELLRRVTDDFASEAAPQGFSIEATIPAASEFVLADPDALSRAVWNLLDNAVKYSGESRTVWIELDQAGGSIAIRVRDRGIGIPRTEQNEIFRKFVRGAEAQKQGVQGTGIGLAMVRHIVEGHRGSVQVESTPGQGSAFTILIPREH